MRKVEFRVNGRLIENHLVKTTLSTLDQDSDPDFPVIGSREYFEVENYSKGNNVEEALSKENIPIPDLPDNFVWMQVRLKGEIHRRASNRDCTEVSQDRDCMEVSQDRDCMEVSQDRDCTEVSQGRVLRRCLRIGIAWRCLRIGIVRRCLRFARIVDYSAMLVYIQLARIMTGCAEVLKHLKNGFPIFFNANAGERWQQDASHVVYYMSAGERWQQDAPHVVYYMSAGERWQQDAPHVVYYMSAGERWQQDAPHVVYYMSAGERWQQDAPHVVYYISESKRWQQDAPHVVYYLSESKRWQQDASHVVYYMSAGEHWQQDAPHVVYYTLILVGRTCTICPQVSAGSKMRSVLGFAMKSFKDERCIVWTGSGPAISKTISCAEIMKRRYRNTHQITKIGYRKVEEFWEPQIEDLDPLVVVREIPIIHILLSKDELNSEEPGYVHVLESVAVEGSYPVETTVQCSRVSHHPLYIRSRGAVVSAPDYEPRCPGLDSRLVTWISVSQGELSQRSPRLCRKLECWGKKKLLATSSSQCCETYIFEGGLFTLKQVNDPFQWSYQPPGNTDVFWRAKENTPDSRRGTGKKLGKSPRVSEEQFAALGLRKGPKRAHRNPGGGGGGEHGKAQKGAAAGGEGSSDVQDV
uniref:DNA/RNA-binding protein Alba-like domain-containing protein n=1 Tax=Timema douglasi TaxID=61478 RepID=A0A7R8VLU7_TIMDO|nr:unnamed protein product [Timema douglasi]